MFCKNCGTLVKEGAKFCLNCGAMVSVPAVSEPEPPEETPKEETSEMELSCKNCGTVLKESATFCGNCGVKVETDSHVDIPQEVKPPDPEPAAPDEAGALQPEQQNADTAPVSYMTPSLLPSIEESGDSLNTRFLAKLSERW
jgi:RNA polymerase subunit RPABC4/transcription elongation factor Spt4